MTLQQAKQLRYRQEIYERGSYDSKGRHLKWRVNGKVKTWKRNPNKVEVPLAHGLYDHSYLNEHNLDDFSTTEQGAKSMRGSLTIRTLL